MKALCVIVPAFNTNSFTNFKFEEKNTMKEWTIMVYMAGDNNLSEDMISALKGMMGFGEDTNINLIALYDGCYPSAPIKIYNFSNAKKVSALGSGSAIITGEDGKPEKPSLKQFEEEFENNEVDSTTPGASERNSAAAREITSRRITQELFRLDDFVSKSIKKFPAKKYALILSGHSDGIIGKRLLPDDDTDAKLNLISFRKIIKEVLPLDNRGEKQKLDIIGFDGCLMGMMEVGYELKGIAKVLVASQGNIPTSGWNYQEMLAELRDCNGAMDATQLAVSLVKSYSDFNEDFAIGGRSVNISACHLEELNKKVSIYTHIQKLAQLFLEILNLPTESKENKLSPSADECTFEQNQVIKEKFIDWMILSHYQSQTFMHNQAVDIVDFTYNLLTLFRKWQAENEILGFINNEYHTEETIANPTVNKIQTKIDSIFNSFIAINQSIDQENKNYLLHSCSIGAEYQFSQGISLFLPWTEMAFQMLEKRYSALQFNKKSENWLKFIERLSALTVREYKAKPLFNKNIESFAGIKFDQIRHREVGGREVGGRGGSESFYFYFSQLRNYRTDVFDKKCADNENFR